MNGNKISLGGMKLDTRCSKCGGKDFEVRNLILPEKKQGMKIELNLYYVQSCMDCGYSEFYLAKVVDKDEEKIKNASYSTAKP